MGMFDGVKAVYDNNAEAVGNWWESDPELDKKVALNSMVHRTLDRTGRWVGKTPMASDIKAGLLGDEDKRQKAELFAQMQSEPYTMNKGVARGWSQKDMAKYQEDHEGRMPGPNDYSPGDQEYNKRIGGIELTNALLGPAEKSKAIGTSGGAVQGTYDPRDQAYDDYLNNPESRELLTQSEDGSYLNGQSLNNIMDNQYMGAGRVLVPSGERGFQNVARYYTHRDDKSNKLQSLAKGTGEFLYDSGAALIGAEQSDNGKAIANTLLAKQMSDRASPIVGDHDNLDDRRADAEEMAGMKENLDHVDYAEAYKHRTGENPHWAEAAAMNALPGFADWMGLITPAAVLQAGAKAGIKPALKAAGKAAMMEAATEDAPIMGGISIPQTLLMGENTSTPEEIATKIQGKRDLHQDMTNGTGQKIKQRLNSAKKKNAVSQIRFVGSPP